MAMHVVVDGQKYTEGRRSISRGEALYFNKNWTDFDREKIGRWLDRYENVTMYTTKSEQYISVRGKHGVPLFWINQGYISIPSSYKDSKITEQVVELFSNHVEHSSKKTEKPRRVSICTNCWTEKSASGACACE